MNIRRVTAEDRGEWVRMRDALWPGSRADHERETETWFIESRPDWATFVLERPGGAMGGFVEASLRPCAEACTTTPVGYLEGLYLDPDLRGTKLARSLVAAAESWAREQGCSEMASDTQPENERSYHVHLALGYMDVGRIVCFRKLL